MPSNKLCLSRLAIAIASVCASTAAVAQAEVDNEHDHAAPTEVIVVTATPLERNQLNSAQPVSVLTGDELREKNAHTLGETLSAEPGINNTHFANVAGSPIIRGLDGPRVKITQNGLDTADVSRGSPDHAVTTETSTATQVEILRGPATLLYGSGAIGGVVNVVDNRIAKQPLSGVTGRYGVSTDTAANTENVYGGINAGNGSVVLHLDGFNRTSDDYEVPEFTNDEGETGDTVENTFIDAKGGNIGLSHVTETSYIGFSYGRLEQEYGIPGHAHHEEEHGEEEHEGEEHAHEEEAGPFADLTQNRFQILGGWNFNDGFVRQLELKVGYTDYEHSEIEDGLPATTFTNQQRELRLSARHQPVAGWDGAVGLHSFDSDQGALGEEAFTPSSETTRHGLFWLGEQSFGDYNWQIGTRYEDVEVTTAAGSETFNPFSLSAGFTRPLTDHLNLAVNFSHAERAPSANELFSNGAHFATRTYELGLGYELHQEGEHEYHVETADQAPQIESSNNIDLGMHYENDAFHLQFNVFFNRVNDFVYGANTGVDNVDLHHEDEHTDGHNEPGHDEHSHDDALPVIAYAQADVDLYGYELEAAWDITDAWKLSAFSDFTRAHLRDGGNLPRIPAQRIGTDITYAAANWDTTVGMTYYGAQNRVADNETTTDSFNLVNASFNYYPGWSARHQLSLYVKAENLTDELGFVHTSFLKDDAPVRGRNLTIGIRGEF